MKNKEADALPSFFINSVPKSGTHLLKNIVLGIPNVTHNPINELYEGYFYQLNDHFRKLSLMNPNEFGAGHIIYSPEWLQMLKQLNMKHIFISRDLRDVVVSYVYFIVEKYPYHPLYDYFTKEAISQKQRYLALIYGVQNDKLKYPSIADWFRPFQGWIKDPYTLYITFEDLVRSKESTQLQLRRIADYLWNDRTPPIPINIMIEKMEERMDQKYSLTFRSGKIGSWKTEFDKEVKDAFKKVAGNILIELGYEKNYKW
ncbi:sulfotransferase domain-containing protein [Bacillus sp. J37]|uniref:sulfotransferase domain-containing protein n=1 Tax=Bacillus sp. J37 TaxID=935837 RepID=UPI00047E3AEC|nr:sulfotransferase domain-containing protein [Bacillus sp. J37]